jgi:predicted ArsR family transcriptional regulator
MGEGDIRDDMARYTVPKAAEVLGISPEAVRNRLSRGTLQSEKVEGRVHVLLPRPDRSLPTDDISDDISSDLVDELRDRVRYLERQVEEERDARRRADTLLAQLMQRIPELEAPRDEPAERPETSSQDPQSAEEPRSGALGPQEGARRHWWRRMFGG